MNKKRFYFYIFLFFLLLQPYFYTVAYASEAKPAVTQEAAGKDTSNDSNLSLYTHQNRKAEGMILIGMVAAGFVIIAIHKPHSKTGNRINKISKK